MVLERVTWRCCVSTLANGLERSVPYRFVCIGGAMLAMGVTPCGPGDSNPSDGGSGDGAAMTVDAPGDPMRDVLLVGNSVSGTVSFLDDRTFENLGSIDVIPDLQDRLDEINANPVTAVAYQTVRQRQAIKHFEPADGDRFVDDVFVSPDGETLYVSRSNLADVAAFDLSNASLGMVWRTHVDGFKADHATLSPDGTQLVVSATTADRADVLDARTGGRVGSFPTGHYPHQNDYSADGLRIYNGSIGDVSLPQALDLLKGIRQLTVVDAKTLQVVRIYPFTAGVRPSVITADEKTMYLQLSYLNGVVKLDLTTGDIIDKLDEPFSDFARANYPTPDDYPHDSAHHGLALSGDGTKLCDAGTIDNTVSIIATAGMTVEHVTDVGLIPYWATTSEGGDRCFVSLSGDNSVSILAYDTGREMVRVTVGKFPQRTRLGRVHESSLRFLSRSPG
jgi:DNA-binding beta-propeller fold protein YncE